MTKLSILFLLIGNFTLSLATTPTTTSPSDETTTYTGVWFVQLADDVLMEMERIELTESFLEEDGTADMEKVENLFNVKEITKQQNLVGKKAIFMVMNNACAYCDESTYNKYCYTQDLGLSYEGQCLGSNVLVPGWCIIAASNLPCMGCSISCNTSILK